MLLLILLGIRPRARRRAVRLGAFRLLFLGSLFTLFLRWLFLFLFGGGLNPVKIQKSIYKSLPDYLLARRVQVQWEILLAGSLCPSRGALFPWQFTGACFVLPLFLRKVLLERVTFNLKSQKRELHIYGVYQPRKWSTWLLCITITICFWYKTLL